MGLLVRPAGRTRWMDQLHGPAGQTRWTDRLDRPAGRTIYLYLKPWPVRIFKEWPFSVYIVAASESDEGLYIFLTEKGVLKYPLNGLKIPMKPPWIIYEYIQRNFWIELTPPSPSKGHFSTNVYRCDGIDRFEYDGYNSHYTTLQLIIFISFGQIR